MRCYNRDRVDVDAGVVGDGSAAGGGVTDTGVGAVGVAWSRFAHLACCAVGGDGVVVTVDTVGDANGCAVPATATGVVDTDRTARQVCKS